MNIPTLHVLVLACSLLPRAYALQESEQVELPPLPTNIESFAPLVGQWRGAGSLFAAADQAQAMEWTASIESAWAAGGCALLETLRVSKQGAENMEWMSLFSYDQVAHRFLHCGVSSLDGFGSSDSVIAVAKGKIVSVWTGDEDGRPYVDQIVWSAEGDARTLAVYRSFEGGAPFVHVSGSFERRGQARGEASVRQPAPLANELKALMPMVGDWDVKALMKPSKNEAPNPFAGRETISPILLGKGLMMHSRLTGGYEAITLIGWDRQRQAYRRGRANNWGETWHETLYEVSSAGFSLLGQDLFDGVPTPNMTRILFQDGALRSGELHFMAGGEAYLQGMLTFTPRS